LFGFISNLYVVTVIALYKPMHKQLTNIYITNQSVIDSTVALFLFFTTLFEDDKRKRTPGNGLDEAICRLWYTKVSAYIFALTKTDGFPLLVKELLIYGIVDYELMLLTFDLV